MRGLAATQARPKRLFSQAKVIHDKIVHFFELDMSLALYFAQKLLRKAKLSRGSARTAKSCSKRQKLLNTLHSCRILAPPHPSLILFLRVSPGPRIRESWKNWPPLRGLPTDPTPRTTLRTTPRTTLTNQPNLLSRRKELEEAYLPTRSHLIIFNF